MSLTGLSGAELRRWRGSGGWLAGRERKNNQQKRYGNLRGGRGRRWTGGQPHPGTEWSHPEGVDEETPRIFSFPSKPDCHDPCSSGYQDRTF